MILTPDFNFEDCGYDLSSDELAFLVREQYPNLVHGVDFWCMHYVKENSAERLSTSVIVDWKPQDIPEPSFEDIRSFEAGSTGLTAFRVTNARLHMFNTLSPRQLWLAAYTIGITKNDVIVKIQEMEDKEAAGRYLIELQEPPSKGYARDSDAVTVLTSLMDIDPVQLDTLWLWAQTL